MTTTLQTLPELENLEARDVPAVVFASYADGTWAYNDTTDSWRHITNAKPMAMDEGADGQLFASYASGTWLYSYQSNHWWKLTDSTTTVMSAPDVGNALFASFESGTFRWKGNVWLKTTSAQATLLAGVDDKEYYGAFSNGTYQWNANQGAQLWTKITSAQAVAMDAVSDGTLFASYADGTWKFDGGWAKFTNNVATVIEAVSDDEVYWSGSFGVWHMDNGQFDVYTPLEATSLTYDNGSLFTTFDDIGGTWQLLPSEIWDMFEDSKANKMAH